MSSNNDPQTTFRGYRQYVREVDYGTGYVAGPKSKKYETGQMVSEGYYKSVKAGVNFSNRTKGLMENDDPETPDTYAEAQEAMSQFAQLYHQKQAAETEAEREDIQDRINELRSDLGS